MPENARPDAHELVRLLLPPEVRAKDERRDLPRRQTLLVPPEAVEVPPPAAPLARCDEDGSLDLGGGESAEAPLGALEVVPRRVKAEHLHPATVAVVERRVALRAFETHPALLKLLARDPESSPNHLDLTNESPLALRILELPDDRELRGESPQSVVREAGIDLAAHHVELGTRELSSSLLRASVRFPNLELLDESRRVLDEHRRRQRTTSLGGTTAPAR